MPPNHSIQRMGASRSRQWQSVYQWRLAPTADAERSPMRAARAKLKSCRDVMIVAQGQRGTSAALGSERKVIPSPSSGLARQPAGAPNQKKGRVGMGWLLPRAATSAALPWAIIFLPPPGRRRTPLAEPSQITPDSQIALLHNSSIKLRMRAWQKRTIRLPP